MTRWTFLPSSPDAPALAKIVAVTNLQQPSLGSAGILAKDSLGLKFGEHLSGDFSTIRVRQSVWRGSVQTPKTDNAVREIDIPTSLAALLKASVGGRTSGFLFQSESGRPLTYRNVLRDGLGKIRRDMQLEGGKAFHAFP